MEKSLGDVWKTHPNRIPNIGEISTSWWYNTSMMWYVSTILVNSILFFVSFCHFLLVSWCEFYAGSNKNRKDQDPWAVAAKHETSSPFSVKKGFWLRETPCAIVRYFFSTFSSSTIIYLLTWGVKKNRKLDRGIRLPAIDIFPDILIKHVKNIIYIFIPMLSCYSHMFSHLWNKYL